MKQLIRFLFLSLAFLVSKESFALNCTGFYDGNLGQTATIASSVAIPPTLPVGSVIWRSPTYTVDIKCWQEEPYGPESAYLYMNITDPNQLLLGGQIELGLNYYGQDYYCSSPSMQSGGHCRMKLDLRFEGCESKLGCSDKAQRIWTTFNFFIAKKKDGLPGQEGALPNMPASYLAVQFNGEAGVNTLPSAKNYTIKLEGLSNLRYVACSATVDLSPRVIDFGRISSFAAKKGATIEDRPILITAVKTCTSPYGLGGSFIPISGVLADANKSLVPANNSSVAIQLLNKQDSKPILFNKEFQLAPLNSGKFNVKKDIVARLLWNSNKAVIGNFNASARFEVYYK